MTTSLWNACRKPKASRAARTQASGSSPFTCRIGAWTILATSVGYTEVRAASGAVVKPSWLLMTMWMVPPVRYPASPERLRVSATTPWPAKAASPCNRIDSTGNGSPAPSSKWGPVPCSPPRASCLARAMPTTTGSTASRWDGFDAIVTGIDPPERATNEPTAPLWYFTSPEPWTDSGSRFPSNSSKISP